jgi:hypothetical protein
MAIKSKKTTTSSKPRSVKKNPVAKTAAAVKPTQENLQLELNQLINNLTQQWAKRDEQLKKQLDTLRAKQQKASEKQKATKTKRVELAKKLKIKATKTVETQFEKAKLAYDAAVATKEALVQELSLTRTEAAYAKRMNQKYSKLAQLVDKFEKEWEKSEATEAKPKKRGRKPKAATAAPAAKVTKAPLKRGRKPKAKTTANQEAKTAVEPQFSSDDALESLGTMQYEIAEEMV